MSVKRATKPIPSIGSPTQTIEINDYSKGMNSFLSNDKFPVESGKDNFLRLAQDARITTLGEYETRKGFDFHSDPAGETQDDEQESTTGAADQSFGAVTRLAQPFTNTPTSPLTKIQIRLKNDASATGTVIVEVWTNSGGAPDTMVTRSTIASSTITGTYAYVTVRFPDAPTLSAATDYWIVVYSSGTGSYKWSSTTTATTSLTSSDSGDTWDANAFDLNFKQFYSTTGECKGLLRAYKSDGTKVTLFVHGTVLYSVNDVTGALTTVKSGLSASATHYEFAVVNDIVYYVNEYDGLRKWDFTTESQVNSTNYSLIIVHQGLLCLVETADRNKLVYSNFADYETFTSTDFIYVPSPKTGDPVTALVSLNGYLLLFTHDNKYILSGTDNATFSLDQAPDKKGTYTQRTVTSDKNYAYFLSDDGVYRSNGTEPALMSENIYQDIIDTQHKEDACMVVSQGRLYLWVHEAAGTNNSVCYVWNLNYGSGAQDVVESRDTNAYVSFAMNCYRDDDALLVASSRVGQVYWQELPSNDYNNLGGEINFELRTHYLTGVSPAVLKEYRHWQPRFGAQSGNYTVSCEYATDLRDNWQVYSAPNVQGAGETYGSGITYGSGAEYGITAEIQEYLYVPGEYRRTAVRYKHYAAREPNTFLGHTLIAQSRRIR